MRVSQESPIHRIEGDVFSAEIEETGARIRSVVHRRTDRELLHRASWGSAPPLPRTEAAELGWLRRFADGWNVLVPHAGDARVLGGVRHPFHGEAARRRWSLSGTRGTCRASVRLRSAGLELHRTVSTESRQLVVEQEIMNASDRAESFSWVEHPVFDAALLGETGSIRVGSSAIAPAREGSVAFDDVAATAGVAEFDVPSLGGRLRLTWDRRVLPHAYVWQERRATAGFPWFLEADGFALEPASHPSGHPSEGLGPLRLEPGARMSAAFQLELLS